MPASPAPAATAVSLSSPSRRSATGSSGPRSDVAAAPARPTSVAVAVRRGVVAALPIAASLLPFGGVVGVACAEIGMAGWPVVAATAVLLSGAAQLATVGVLATGGGLAAVAVTVALINLRLLLYSALMADDLRRYPLPVRVLASLTIVDQTVALRDDARAEGPAFATWWLAASATMVAAWVTGVTMGLVLGDVLPSVVPTAVAAPAAFVALLVPQLDGPRTRRAAGAAAVVAVVARGLPAGLGLACALFTAMVVTSTHHEEVPS